MGSENGDIIDECILKNKQQQKGTVFVKIRGTVWAGVMTDRELPVRCAYMEYMCLCIKYMFWVKGWSLRAIRSRL